MKNAAVLLFLFLFATHAFGQVNQPVEINQLQDWAREPRVLAENSRAEVDGSPFYNENWLSGYVIINDETKSNTVQLKYSAHNNELWFRENGKVMALPPNKLKGFVLVDDHKEIQFRNGFTSPEHDITAEQLMRVIHDSKVKLIAKEFHPMSRDKDPFTGEMEYTFFSKTDYFLVGPNGQIHDIKLKAKDITNALNVDREILERYAESNNLEFDQEEDLKKLLAHAENL